MWFIFFLNEKGKLNTVDISNSFCPLSYIGMKTSVTKTMSLNRLNVTNIMANWSFSHYFNKTQQYFDGCIPLGGAIAETLNQIWAKLSLFLKCAASGFRTQFWTSQCVHYGKKGCTYTRASCSVLCWSTNAPLYCPPTGPHSHFPEVWSSTVASHWYTTGMAQHKC